MSLNIPATTRKRVVVIGGGFGGMKLIDSLRRSGFQLVLIDQNNYHQFQPLLYQVATAGLNPGSIAFPFRKDFRHIPDFHFRMARVTRIVPRENQIETTIGSLGYDYLVIAAGTTTNYYGMQNIQAHALPMKSVTEAMALRNHILTKFEEALTADDATKRQRLLNLVVVGGGATGVEISGALAEMKRYVLQKDYPDLTSATLHIYLVEGTSKVLGNMSPEASEKAGGFLSRMGVKLLLDTRVTDYRDGAIVLANGESIPTETVIWVDAGGTILKYMPANSYPFPTTGEVDYHCLTGEVEDGTDNPKEWIKLLPSSMVDRNDTDKIIVEDGHIYIKIMPNTASTTRNGIVYLTTIMPGSLYTGESTVKRIKIDITQKGN